MKRKQIKLFALLATAAVMITGCAGNVPDKGAPATTVPTSDAISEKDELTFPVGQAVDAQNAFIGTAYVAPMINNDNVYNFPQTNSVTFEPGARSNWHSHGGMIILVTGGVGYYQEEGKPAQIIRTGDVVECPEGVKHWHGAAADSWFSQMVIYDSHYEGSAEGEEPEPVTDEAYGNLETEEHANRNITSDNQFMFQRAEEPTILDTFNGAVYLSSIIEDGNVAAAPGLHYVVFDKGVINNWHTHEGGQILIATNGIGYHQIEGEAVQVLYPGDVAICPPGVKHWHGGSADTEFAHIAVNTNPELTGLEWFERISDEEYNQLTTEKTAANDSLTTNGGAEIEYSQLSYITSDESAPEVFYTSDISSDALLKAYNALKWTPTGKVAVKLSTGEPPASNYLDPNLIKELVQQVDGTIVENNTAYGGARASTAAHYQVAKDHGFTEIADFQILDEDGSMTLSVNGGTRLSENLVGKAFGDYDSYLVLSHFKGHAMAGFGGAIKNISIGLGSSEGKTLIHTAGKGGDMFTANQDGFLESMGDAAKSVSDYLGNGKRIVYVNVLNRLSVDCDCDGNPAEPDMHDIGIVASTDPLAIDQACIDLVYGAPDHTSLAERIESRNGIHTLENADIIGLGSRNYRLINLDKQ